jgi:sugar O-acyltransferase (sialic acid O-acetyltransferase NeuD family)
VTSAQPPRNVVLFGIGSPIIAEYVETCNRLGYTVAAAVRNRPGPVYFRDERVVADAGDFAPVSTWSCFCPLFTPRNRFVAVAEATQVGWRFAGALIDPTAVVASSCAIGDGGFVNAACVVGAESTLHEHVLVNRAAAIGHHVEIGAFASVGPGVVVGGLVTIGSGAMLGAGAVILPQLTIGAHAVVGAGAVVVRDVPAHSKVLGNPARIVDSALPGFDGGEERRARTR